MQPLQWLRQFQSAWLRRLQRFRGAKWRRSAPAQRFRGGKRLRSVPVQRFRGATWRFRDACAVFLKRPVALAGDNARPRSASEAASGPGR